MGRWLRLGDIELLVVNDGVMRQDAGATFGLVPRVMWERYVPDLDDKYRLPMGLNSLVIRAGGKTVIVDTGVGSKRFRPPGAVSTESAGRLLENLTAEGIRPGDVDIVINTHLHFDHCGGNTVEEEGSVRPAFPRARYFVQAGEWEAAERGFEAFLRLPADLREFIRSPKSEPYLRMALKMSDIPVDKVRTMGEGFLEITL